MTASNFEGSLDDVTERHLWFRLSSSIILVGAAVGWASAVVVCCLAAPLSLALGADGEQQATSRDDL
jgi:hypothetical protein